MPVFISISGESSKAPYDVSRFAMGLQVRAQVSLNEKGTMIRYRTVLSREGFLLKGDFHAE